jgi:hypothetical protein
VEVRPWNGRTCPDWADVASTVLVLRALNLGALLGAVAALRALRGHTGIRSGSRPVSATSS